MNPFQSKASLRATALAYRTGLPASERQRYSGQIIDRLCAYLASQDVPPVSLLVYRSMPSEVATESLFHMPQYQVFAPITRHQTDMEWFLVTAQTDWQKGRFGVLEPSAGTVWQYGQSTALLCPLTAFDRQGNRLGMGKGCFDFWLSQHRHGLDQVIGLAFSGQEVAHIPAEAHDAPLNCIITEKEAIECPKA
ncbi:MAG: 5-formyltetrahydrofolate cyclo-ligase [Mariprofundus sp.]|nr:5-formyltetrahydrofolate cyclo-ligase [Mariprofundus sp.]